MFDIFNALWYISYVIFYGWLLVRQGRILEPLVYKLQITSAILLFSILPHLNPYTRSRFPKPFWFEIPVQVFQ